MWCVWRIQSWDGALSVVLASKWVENLIYMQAAKYLQLVGYVWVGEGGGGVIYSSKKL